MADNMGLEVIAGSDYISPTVINNNFAKLDALGVDYVVETGYSGDWWYRKWSSGRAECGVDFKQFGQVTLSKNANGLCISGSLTFGAYPIAFASRPHASVAFEGDALSSSRGSFCAMKHSTSTTQSPAFFVCDWSTNAMKPACGIYVTGRWK